MKKIARSLMFNSDDLYFLITLSGYSQGYKVLIEEDFAHAVLGIQ